MVDTEFESMKKEFSTAPIDKQIKLYVEAEGLTQEQYKELLRMFPVSALAQLEAAL